MTPLVLAALLQASLPMFEENPIPLDVVPAKEGQTVVLHLEPLGVTVQKPGKGSGVVTSQPPGINCGFDCTELYAARTEVTLTAVPDKGSEFKGWEGDCAGLGVCKVTVDRAHLVTAPFEAVQVLKLNILAGAQVLFATEADTAYNPLVRIETSVPLSKNPKAPNLLVGIDLGGSQGAAVGLEDIQSWTTIEATVGASLYPLPDLNVGLWAEGGFSSHLPGDTTPRVKAPRWAYGGVILDRFDAGSLVLGLGVDQRLDGFYQPAVKIKGRLALYQAKDGGLSGAQVSLVGEAILGINLSEYSMELTGGVHDVIRAGLTVGWGTRK